MEYGNPREFWDTNTGSAPADLKPTYTGIDPEDEYKQAQKITLPPDALSSITVYCHCGHVLLYSHSRQLYYCSYCGKTWSIQAVEKMQCNPLTREQWDREYDRKQESIERKITPVKKPKPREPIMRFESIEQARASLGEWQKRLFLEDWIIRVKLVNKDELSLDNVSGEVDFEYTNKSAVIRVLKDIDDDFIAKIPHELTLVHELLHLKYNLVHPAESGNHIEQVFYDMHEHMLLEQMAKSLIMAKYGLPYEWFDASGDC